MTKRRQMTSSEMGRKGGKNRAKNLTPERRQEIGRQAAQARWGKRKREAA